MYFSLSIRLLLYFTRDLNQDPASFQPRSQGLFPGSGAGQEKERKHFPAPPPSQGKDPGNEVGFIPLLFQCLRKWSLHYSLELMEEKNGF